MRGRKGGRGKGIKGPCSQGRGEMWSLAGRWASLLFAFGLLNASSSPRPPAAFYRGARDLAKVCDLGFRSGDRSQFTKRAPRFCYCSKTIYYDNLYTSSDRGLRRLIDLRIPDPGV